MYSDIKVASPYDLGPEHYEAHPVTIYHCWACDEPICSGDTYYDLPKVGAVCESCVRDMMEVANE